MFFIKIYIKESYINYYDTSIQMCGQYCILAQWHYWEDRRVRMGLKNLEMSKAQIAKKYGLSPSTFGNRTLGKVQGYEHCSGRARQPRVLSAGKQPICFSTDTLFGVHVGKLI